MHHAPAGPPLFPRLAGALIRLLRPLRRFVVVRPRRAVPLLLLSLVVAVLGLGIPVVSSDVLDRPAVALDASSSTSAQHPGRSLVRLGVDGDPAGGSSSVQRRGSAGTGSPSGAGRPTASSPAAAGPAGGTAALPPGSGSPPPSATPGTTATGTTAAGTTSSDTNAPGTTTGPRSPASPAPSSSSPSTSAPASGPATTATASPAADTAAEAAVLSLVNQQRAGAGCPAVTVSSGLATLARAHSADMRDRGYFDHTDPDGRSPFDRGTLAGVRVLAENIARGQATAAAVMDAWMNSPGHRANILNCSYRTIGVGVADGSGGPWWTQELA